ncbi:tRNA cyclic N6-threonylcarbamoyladenosine(37) synthase TcdA [Opitutaceae bacterium EW11]|nr:tRNA cyclic N6-threonylcarbamoyladenosine(37) synthase TcdA [Opitutaceae bacterium EW11]
MCADYIDRFGGVARLLGTDALRRLASAHMAVVGLGGVGSWAVEALARSGVGRLTLIDLDDVCVTNVNRQLPALDGQIGRPKAVVLAERVQLINPGCVVEAVTEFLTKASSDRLLGGGFDVVIDAIDDLNNKSFLIAECVRRKLRCVTVGGAGGKRDLTQVRTADLGASNGDDLLRLVRKKLRREYGFTAGEHVVFGVRCVYSGEHPVYPWSDGSCSAEPEPGSDSSLNCNSGFGTATYVTGTFGFAAAQEAVELVLAAEPVRKG